MLCSCWHFVVAPQCYQDTRPEVQWEAGEAATASGIEWMRIFLRPESLHLSLKEGNQRQHHQDPKDKNLHIFGFSKNTIFGWRGQGF